MGYTIGVYGGIQMPWKESSLMDGRIKFVARILDGDKITVVSREFSISRKTGYNIYNWHKQGGY